MKNKVLLLLMISVFCYACNTSTESYERFFIPKGASNQGIINKYYIHNSPKDNQTVKTTLDYSVVKKINDSVYEQINYNPAFTTSSIREFSILNDKLKELSHERYYSRDTLVAAYENTSENYFLTFGKETATYNAKLKTKSENYITVHQTTKFIKDTTIASKPAKIVEQDIANTFVFGTKPKDTMHFHYRNIYVQDLGLYSSTLTTEKNRLERVLVEQISPDAFEELSDHDIKRVGYIDFDDTIDKNLDFNLCSDHKSIFDYYNGRNDRAGFIGGKGNLKKLVTKQLDTTKLKNESGYLTYRFVINCKGEAGKYVTNEADFDYNEKEFDVETKTHLYKILSSVEKWKPCIIRNQSVDSYFYITFILKNGKIEDILP